MKISVTVFGNDPLGFPQSCFTTLNLLNSGASPSAWDIFSFFSASQFYLKRTQKDQQIYLKINPLKLKLSLRVKRPPSILSQKFC